ncbi:MAG: tetratricopeptide repeat protein, partial [Planctomycetota bacterium]
MRCFARSIRVPLLCLTLALSSFATGPSHGQDEASPPETFATERDEVRDFFLEVEKATRLDDASDLVALYDMEAYAERVIALADVELPPGVANMIMVQTRGRMKQQFELLADKWTRHKITYLNFSDDGYVAEAVVRSWSDDATTTRTLFRLEKDGEWRIVDWTDLTLGVSAVAISSALLRDGMEAEMPPDFAVSVKLLLKAVVEMSQGNVYSANDTLKQMVGRRVPPAMESIRWCLSAAASAALDPADAFESVEKLSSFDERAFIADYLRFIVSLELGQSQLVIENANSYLDAFGPDAEAYFALGYAYLESGESEKALDAFRQGLADTPEYVELVEAFGLALPADKKTELKAAFKALPDPMGSFEYLADSFETDLDHDALEVLLQTAVEIGGEILNRVYYESVVRIGRGDAISAFEELAKALSSLSEDEEPYREWYEALLCDAAIESGNPMRAYDVLPDKPAAFEILLDRLDMATYQVESDDAATEKAEKQKIDDWVDGLFQKHREDFKDDSTAYHLLGKREYYQDRTKRAVELLNQALRLAQEESRSQILYDLVLCHFELESQLEFYRSSTPEDQPIVFGLLRDYWDSTEDGYEGLEALHRMNFPDEPQFQRSKMMELYREGNYDGALQLASDLLEQEEEVDFSLQAVRIACLAHSGQFDRAIVHAREADDGLRQFFRAVVYAIKGNKTNCLEAMRRAYTQDGFAPDEVEFWVDLPDDWKKAPD